MSAVRTLLEADRRNGNSPGYWEGYRLGGCQAVLGQIPVGAPEVCNLRVMYVQQGFDAIDRGVISALEEVAAACIVTQAAEMLAQAAWVRPDLVLVMNGLHVFPPEHAAHIDELRAMGIRTAVWFVDDPYLSDDTVSLALHYDEVFTHELAGVTLYKEIGCRNVHYLPLAASTDLFRPQPVQPQYQYDICFIGNAFWNRVELFDSMASFLEGKRVLIAGGFWDRLSNMEKLASCVQHGWIDPEETVRYYNGAKIVINIHRPTQAGQDNRNSRNLAGRSINPRTYEISACGAFQITDIREDLTKYYRPGYDIETFSSKQELQDKITYYLEHEQERITMAWRSLWTTRKHHTFRDRISRLLAAAVPS
ncbi:CgeB family protein [Paenibacillus sp. SN-8-1]|uniref:CgeB family protein n=1 Tax=Paenibacillus sp. SN-8-1 TaxID=3435409 RepID=UPI003D9A8958